VIRTVVGEPDLGIRDRPFLLARVRQQLTCGLDGGSNVAVTENGGIGKSIDGLDEQQAADGHRSSEALNPCR
jgi:hypothetical protein